MSLDRERKVRAQLERHVERLADTPDLQFQFLPTDLTLSETAAYLLLVASVNQGAGAEAVGKFVQLLWDRLDRQLFRLHRYKREQVDSFVADTRKAAGVNRTRELDDANVLRSATQYLAEASDLIAHAAGFSTPAALVDELGRSVEHFGKHPSGARKKAWMYLRWMVRPAPDLRLFTTFQARDLQIPLDVNTCRAIGVLRTLLPSDEYLSALELESGRPIANAANRELATRFAGTLRPDDPAGLDYPLFLLGRERDIAQALGSETPPERGSRLTIIACTKSKQRAPCPAAEMYAVSPLFRESLRQAKEDGARVAILSAKYGLIAPDRVIEPYELSLQDLTEDEQHAWASMVLEQLDELAGDDPLQVTFLAGTEYRNALARPLQQRGIVTRVHPNWRVITATVFG